MEFELTLITGKEVHFSRVWYKKFEKSGLEKSIKVRVPKTELNSAKELRLDEIKKLMLNSKSYIKPKSCNKRL